MRVLELRIPPVALFLLMGACMWGASCYLVFASLSLPFAGILSAVIGTTGAAVAVAGVIAFRRHSTTVDPTQPGKASVLVRSGIYERTRNPMYLGLALLLTGWAIYLGNVVSLLFVPVFVICINELQIKPEERALGTAFGEDFADYRASVRRWL